MLRRILGVLVALALAFIIMPIPSASADRYRLMASYRYQEEYFVRPLWGDKVDITSSSRFVYRYYPNGKSAWYALPVFQESCWFQPERESHRLFDGTRVNLRTFSETGSYINPGPMVVPDVDRRWNCRTQTFAPDMREPIYGFNEPRWAGSFTIRLNGMNDHHHEYGEGTGDGNTYKKLNPRAKDPGRQDDIVSNWRKDRNPPLLQPMQRKVS